MTSGPDVYDPYEHISNYRPVAVEAALAGCFIGSILYGVLIMVFFRCMAAFFRSAYRREEGIKWGLVSYTVAMFSFVTVYTAINLRIQSNSFTNGGDFCDEAIVYQYMSRPTAFGLIPNVMFSLNNWLADGLLIYRCYVIYSSNLWVIAFPCLMYLGSVGTGIVQLNFQDRGHVDWAPMPADFGVPYLSISVSLNILLTLMIVIRLVLHSRNIRAATGMGTNGLYKAISTMLIESCALFAVNSLLVIGPLIGGNYVAGTFFPILAETQVIAPLLIIQRVADWSALTGHTITTGRPGSFNVRRRGEPMGNSGGHVMNPVDEHGNKSGELEVVVEKKFDFHLHGKV